MLFRTYKRGSSKAVCILMRHIVAHIHSVAAGLFVFSHSLSLYSPEGSILDKSGIFSKPPVPQLLLSCYLQIGSVAPCCHQGKFLCFSVETYLTQNIFIEQLFVEGFTVCQGL